MEIGQTFPRVEIVYLGLWHNKEKSATQFKDKRRGQMGGEGRRACS